MFLLLPLGRIGEAIDQLEAAEEIDRESAATHSALSLALRSAGRWDEVDAHCQRAASNDRERGSCWFRCSCVREMRNKPFELWR